MSNYYRDLNGDGLGEAISQIAAGAAGKRPSTNWAARAAQATNQTISQIAAGAPGKQNWAARAGAAQATSHALATARQAAAAVGRTRGGNAARAVEVDALFLLLRDQIRAAKIDPKFFAAMHHDARGIVNQLMSDGAGSAPGLSRYFKNMSFISSANGKNDLGLYFLTLAAYFDA